MKKKNVAGVDLPSYCFAYVGDETNQASWLLPLFVPGDAKKTSNLIASALHRVNEVKGIPDSERVTVRLLLYGAALAHGLRVDRSKFTAPIVQTAEPAPPVFKSKPIKKQPDPVIDAAAELADYRATQLLRSLGWE